MADFSMPTDVYTDEDGGAYIQAAPGKTRYYLGDCLNSDALPNPKSDTNPIWCLDSNREYAVVGRTKSPPGKITTSLTSLMDKTATWLEHFVEDFCPFWLHYTLHKCGSRGIWAHWERVFSIYVTSVTDDSISNIMAREGGSPVERAYSLTAMPPRYDTIALGTARRTTTEDLALNDVWAVPKDCAENCGTARNLGEQLMAGADGDVAITANIQFSDDYGITWAPNTDPFAAALNIMSGTAFQVDRDTVRHLVVRNTLAATPLQTRYTDDNGATWSVLANAGAVVAEFATGPQSLFSLNMENIWLAGSSGTIYFSNDGGATWADQGAVAASGANDLNAVAFWNASIGYAVGDVDTIIYTTDGGGAWAAAAATGSGDDILSLAVLGPTTLVVTTDAGLVYHSWDSGATWTLTWTAPALTPIPCVSFSTPVDGLLIHNTAAPVGTIYQTADGGYSWRAITTPGNDGLNSVIMLSPSRGWAVGEVSPAATTAVIVEIS